MRVAVAAADFLDFLLPTGCIACGDWLTHTHRDGLLCGRCRSRLRRASWPRCPRCHYPRGTGRHRESECRECQDWPDCLARARHAVLMEPPADTLVHALKYEGWVELAPLMAQAMCEQELPWLGSSGPVLVVPMPTTPARERKRGYNQAERLAHGISEAMGWPLVPGLRRTGTGPTQVSLPASRRWANVRSAFEIEGGTARRLAGARVVLVDDVLTTGSTACAAALVLARAGTAQVNLVTYARAISFRPVGR